MNTNTWFKIVATNIICRHFDKEMNHKLLDKQDVKLEEKPMPRPPTPKYTGYGSWDDSMSSVLHLIPKKPKKDLAKLFFNDGEENFVLDLCWKLLFFNDGEENLVLEWGELFFNDGEGKTFSVNWIRRNCCSSMMVRRSG
jgi:hypothetical protein